MGLIYADVEFRNPAKAELKPMTVRMLVDTGASYTCLPEHVVTQLGLDAKGTRDITTADGAEHTVPYVGPLEVRYDNRLSFSGALQLGDEPLLGAITMQDMDVVVSLKDEKLVVNPKNPNIAGGRA